MKDVDMDVKIPNGLNSKNISNERDPWIHRLWGMKCKTCIWFVPKISDETPVINIGRCRRHAPTMNGYPVVFVNDWCGDHRVDENKI